MKVNELENEIIAEYLKKDDSEDLDEVLMESMKEAAVEYIKNQTGIGEEELNSHDDLTIAVLVLIQDMYDNRRMYVDNQNVNRVVDGIIYQYSENLL